MKLEIQENNKLFPVTDWGQIDYNESNLKQQNLIQKIYDDKRPGEIIFCTHAPVVTTGRATKESDLWGWAGEVIKSPRGGRATYHGPSQLVIYPLVNLSYDKFNLFKKKDVTSYIRLLEKVVINTLAKFNIEAYQRCEKIEVEGESLEATGVWVGDKKIASIGIAVRRWVAYHGIAINIFKDDKAFSGINPCGFAPSTMVSMQELTGEQMESEEIKAVFVSQFKKLIS